jgi:hypothetical protein
MAATWHVKMGALGAASQWHVEPLALHFRNPEPPTITMRAQRIDLLADPIMMTIELTDADLLDWDDLAGAEVPASLLGIVQTAAGRIVADLRGREA